jgi:hypothetical protein
LANVSNFFAFSLSASAAILSASAPPFLSLVSSSAFFSSLVASSLALTASSSASLASAVSSLTRAARCLVPPLSIIDYNDLMSSKNGAPLPVYTMFFVPSTFFSTVLIGSYLRVTALVSDEPSNKMIARAEDAVLKNFILYIKNILSY